jgi:hypothetical protein
MNLKGSGDGNTENHLIFWSLSSARNSDWLEKPFLKLDLHSYSRKRGEGGDAFTLLGPLERANIIGPGGPNRVGVSLPSPERWEEIQFPKHCVFKLFRIPDDAQSPQSQSLRGP